MSLTRRQFGQIVGVGAAGLLLAEKMGETKMPISAKDDLCFPFAPIPVYDNMLGVYVLDAGTLVESVNIPGGLWAIDFEYQCREITYLDASGPPQTIMPTLRAMSLYIGATEQQKIPLQGQAGASSALAMTVYGFRRLMTIPDQSRLKITINERLGFQTYVSIFGHLILRPDGRF